MESTDPVDDLYVEANNKKVKISLTDRADVQKAFELDQSKTGIELNIPDAFDSIVSDYKITCQGHEIFSYGSQHLKLAETYSNISSIGAEASSHKTNYEKGRHVVFIFEEEAHRKFFDAISQPAIRRSFPRKLSGCEFSHITLESFSSQKKHFLSNIKNIILVLPSNLYAKLNKISPTCISSGKLISLYHEGVLFSKTGLHQHQLNNFILNKTQEIPKLQPYQASVVRIWEAIENYADLIFGRTNNLFFIASSSEQIEKSEGHFISEKIQGKRNEDVIKIKKNKSEILLLNISAYCKMFDVIGKKDFWEIAVKRGLKHKTLAI